MLLRLASLGALGYAAYSYYTKNREQVDGTFRRLTQSNERGDATPSNAAGQRGEDLDLDLAGGPLSGNAQLVHAREGPVA